MPNSKEIWTDPSWRAQSSQKRQIDPQMYALICCGCGDSLLSLGHSGWQGQLSHVKVMKGLKEDKQSFLPSRPLYIWDFFP